MVESRNENFIVMCVDIIDKGTGAAARCNIGLDYFRADDRVGLTF